MNTQFSTLLDISGEMAVEFKHIFPKYDPVLAD
jgi:hypothetical protein